MSSPAIDGWFTTGERPALLADRCHTCATVFFPPTAAADGFCRNPVCQGETFETVEIGRRGRVWSYTNFCYQPPSPFVPRSAPYEPFALAAVELDEGLVVLGQVADGFGVEDLRVGAEVELVVQPAYTDEVGERTIWRWRPIGGGNR